MTGKSIILIGMPGAGKSTVGPLLAEKLGLTFVDTDVIIEKSDGRKLRDIVAQDGYEGFLEIQQKVIESRKLVSCVIATGGSVVKSEALMRYLRSLGRIIYLKADVNTLEQRLAPERKLARADGQTFRELYMERGPLYEKYAECIIDCTGKNPEEIALEASIWHPGSNRNV